jgi:hypothetical protein
MANTFKSYVAANVLTGGTVIYTVPSSTTGTVIGLSLSNKGTATVTANVFLTRSSVDYSIISNVPITSGSTLVPVGAEQKLVMQDADELKITVSANSVVDCIASLLETT